MKLRCLLPLVPLAPLVLAASICLAETIGFDSLVAAERGFARVSAERGMRAAFLEHLASDGIVFRPGPLNGMRVWQSRGESRAVLAWTPAYAELSGAGDLGFSSGPWTFAGSKDAAPSAFGEFVSVWRRGGDGAWKVALDIGISHADPATALDHVTLTAGPAHAAPEGVRLHSWDAGVSVQHGSVGVGFGTNGAGIGVISGGLGVGISTGATGSRGDQLWRRTAHEKNRLMSAERTFGFTARSKGWQSAYRAVAAADLRVYREGHTPLLGPEAAIERHAAAPTTREWQTVGHDIAASWDLGYTYGIAISRPRGARPDTASWTHLWRKNGANEWRMAMDIEAPFPKR